MLRCKETQLWDTLTFHFRCRKMVEDTQNAHKSILIELNKYKSECNTLRSQVFEAKAVFDAMDAKHIEDKEAMSAEIETMRADHLKLLGDFRLAEVEIKASNKYAYDANKATENLKSERQRLIGIVEGLKEDFEQYKLGAPAIMAQGETLSARLEKNDEHHGNKRKEYTGSIENESNVLQEASVLSENAKQIIKDINELSSSPSPLTVAVAEAYIAEKLMDSPVAPPSLNDAMPAVLNMDNSPEYFNKKKKRKGNR